LEFSSGAFQPFAKNANGDRRANVASHGVLNPFCVIKEEVQNGREEKGFSANGKKPGKYTDEIREQAVGMFGRCRSDFKTRSECAKHVAEPLGVGTDETVLNWVRQAEIDGGLIWRVELICKALRSEYSVSISSSGYYTFKSRGESDRQARDKRICDKITRTIENMWYTEGTDLRKVSKN
jgi:hypothetical protein